MSMTNWAEQECRIACKRENPDFNFDNENDWDYGCSCYKSALKAYKSLMDYDHSGSSFGFTKNILIRLMDGLPLTPITDEDFFSVERGTEEFPAECSEWLKERGLKSSLQCPRMSSLFREETLDGKVSYHDNDRAYYIDVEDPSDTYGSSTKFLDEMFPITMPYYPSKEKFKIYCQTFLTDEKNGDFDTKGILYVETPEGKKIDVNIFMTEKNGKMERITREEYDELLKKRIDKLPEKVAGHLIWTLVSNSSYDEETSVREAGYNALTQKEKDEMHNQLKELCKFFDNPEHYKYNTFSMGQALCKGKKQQYENVPELVEIAQFLDKQLSKIMQRAYDENYKDTSNINTPND